MRPFEVFLSLAITLDRDKLKAVIAIPESDLGKMVTELLVKAGQDRKTVEGGMAMLKLTAFYLDELHKLFPSTGEIKK